MTKEIITDRRDSGISGQVKELQTTFVNPSHTKALAQAVSRDPELHSRGAILETMFAHEPGGIPKRAPQRAFTLLSTAVGELRRNRKKLISETEKSVLNAIDAITEANDGSKATIYHLLRERVGISPQGFYSIVLPENMGKVIWPLSSSEAQEPLPKIVTRDEVLANLKEQLYFVGGNPTLAGWVHGNVLRTRFRRELHGIRLDRGRVPQPDEGGFYSSTDAAIIFCLAQFKGRKLPADLDMRQMASEILAEK